MKKPWIGVLPLVDEGRESYWMLPGYLKGILQAGGLPVMLPLVSEDGLLEQMAKAMDGFLFTGGPDVSPGRYGGEREAFCGEGCEERDEMELRLFKKVYSRDKPALGICRGMQLANVALGGTLYQDLVAQCPSEIGHRQPSPYDAPAHSVAIVSASPLGRLLGKGEINVNSCHHQAVRVLSAHLSPMAFSPDGLVEAVYAPGKAFMWAVQWHPEFNYQVEESSRMIFGAFIRAALAGPQESGAGLP